MTTKAKIGDIVAVEWQDAWCIHEESSENDWADSFALTTYGILRRNGDIVTVESETNVNGEGRCTTHIPRGIVSRIRRLT